MLLLISVLLIFIYCFALDSERVLRSYTKVIYVMIKDMLGKFASRVPFAYGEFVVGLLIILGIIFVIRKILQLLKKNQFAKKEDVYLIFTNVLLSLLICILAVLLVFEVIWGLNYHQPSLSSQLDLEYEAVSVQDLRLLLLNLSEELENLRGDLQLTDDNVVTTTLTVDQLFHQALRDYERASQVYTFVSSPSSPPKGIASSILFSYSGISGIYNPFTGEANVNTLNSVYMIPVVALHEMAHQQGIAREDEANFVAFLIAEESEVPLTRYSGKMLVLIHGLNNLAKVDELIYQEVYDYLSIGVKKDLIAHRDLWAKYDGPLEATHEKINDQYLKMNGQESGVTSYGEMINLYIAWSLKNKK